LIPAQESRKKELEKFKDPDLDPGAWKFTKSSNKPNFLPFKQAFKPS
jgi:hypothetical protein